MPSAAPLLAGNLPVEPNSFIGRERDLAELARLLLEVRALTLSGPGGIGKTRLALRLASSSSDEFSEGVWLVDLAAVRKPEALSSEVAHVLGVQEANRSATESLLDWCRPRHALLVLDSCEHLVDASADLAHQLLVGATDRALRGPELQRVVEHVAASDEVRAALTAQSTSLAQELADGIRTRANSLDDVAERKARGWLRRPPAFTPNG